MWNSHHPVATARIKWPKIACFICIIGEGIDCHNRFLIVMELSYPQVKQGQGENLELEHRLLA
jgi:hypothetical protein